MGNKKSEQTYWAHRDIQQMLTYTMRAAQPLRPDCWSMTFTSPCRHNPWLADTCEFSVEAMLEAKCRGEF